MIFYCTISYIGLSLLTANCNCAQQEKCPFGALQMFLRRNPPTVTLPHNFSHGRIKAAERPFRGLKYRMGNVRVKYFCPGKNVFIFSLPGCEICLKCSKESLWILVIWTESEIGRLGFVKNLLISFFCSARTGEGERKNNSKLTDPQLPNFGVCIWNYRLGNTALRLMCH